jgi:hypothetical protein
MKKQANILIVFFFFAIQLIAQQKDNEGTTNNGM